MVEYEVLCKDQKEYLASLVVVRSDEGKTVEYFSKFTSTLTLRSTHKHGVKIRIWLLSDSCSSQ